MLLVECYKGEIGLPLVRPLRRLVFVEQEGYMDATAILLEDEYDRAQNTFHIVAWRNKELAGALRFTLDLGSGTAADKEFDFRPYLPRGAVVAAGGQLCVDRRHRSRYRVYDRLMCCFYLWLASQGVTHVKGVINPLIARLFESSGYRFFTRAFHSAHSNLPCIAVLLEMRNLPAKWTTFMARHGGRHGETSNCRVFLDRGEHLRPTDEPRLRSLIIVNGQAHVIRADRLVKVVADGAELDFCGQLGDGARAQDIEAITEFEAVGFV